MIGANCLLFIWSLYESHLVVAKFTFGVLFIFQLFMLIHFIQRTNRKLTRFLELIRSEGLMERFSEVEKEVSHKKLNEIYNEVLKLISDSKLDKESEHQYFQYTLQAIGTSLISINENGKIDIFNHAASELLQIDPPANLKELENEIPEFAEFITRIKNNEQKLLKLKLGAVELQLSVRCSEFIVRDEKLKLISFQNISPELESEMIETWQKLIKVLRHEVMNSITPIKSLTSTLIRLLSKDGDPKKAGQINDDTIRQACEGLQAIDKRNKGMLRFIESYRTLTKIPTPVMNIFRVRDMMESLKVLLSSELNAGKISIDFDIEPRNLTLYGDEKLLTQCMINLIKNSIDAMQSTREPRIAIQAYSGSNQRYITVKDKGKGIPEASMESIFIPFYTEKEGGTGIGLSLCQQIIHLHKGSISVISKPGIETIFTIILPDH